MCPDIRADKPWLFTAASDRLGWDLDDVIANGPEEELTSTEKAQPALYVTAYALWEEFISSADEWPVAFAGHSLGEYTALAAAKSLSYEDGLDLVAERGRVMADAAAQTESGMAALLGADSQAAEQIARTRRDDGGALYVANINAPGQIVMAGGLADIEWLLANARSLGVRRVIPLRVAGGFHSPFMQSAADRLDVALGATSFEQPQGAVFANATAGVTHNPRRTLAEQLTASVLFSESLEHMAEAGVDTFVHVGPGDVTAGLAKRTVPSAQVMAVSSLVDARNVAVELS
jgi:[acyl-carrier-protein] S-malonyltransferase